MKDPKCGDAMMSVAGELWVDCEDMCLQLLGAGVTCYKDVVESRVSRMIERPDFATVSKEEWRGKEWSFFTSNESMMSLQRAEPDDKGRALGVRPGGGCWR